MAVLTRQIIRFEPFEFAPCSGELFKLGHKLNVRGQPIEVLSILLERPGEVITREELCERLWPQDTFVDFEHSLNTAIKKLRQALDEDVDKPKYIETLPKKGYRFIAEVENVANGTAVTAPNSQLTAESTSAEALASPIEPAPSRKSRPWLYALAAAVTLAVVGFTLYEFVRPRVPVVTGMRQLTRTGHRKISMAPRYLVTDGSRVYFSETANGQNHLAQVSAQGGEVSYIDLPMVGNPHLRDVSEDGSQLLLVDWNFAGSDQPWVVWLPNGPAIKTPFATSFVFSFLRRDKQVLYADTTHLFSANLDGSGVHQVLTTPAPVMAAVPSPDGRRLRYVVNGHIWEGRMDGTGAHRFLPNWNQPVGAIRWSPDGKSFIFQSRDTEGPNLWAVAEGKVGPFQFASRPTRLTSGPLIFRAWTTSPDGKHMYAIGESKRGELSIYDPGSGVFVPYLNGISAALTDFSRDGRWVAYVTYPEGALWRSRVDGSERLRLTPPTADIIANPRWSPDGKFIAYNAWGSNYVWESSEFSHRIYLVPADGGASMLLLAGRFNPGDPNWSPDGKSLVYGGTSSSVLAAASAVTSGEEETEIRILDLESKKSTIIAGSKGLYSPRWSLDGRYIGAISVLTGAFHLYTIENQRWNELPTSRWRVPSAGWITFSNDNQFIYGMQNQQVFRVRLPNGPAELVADLSGTQVTEPAFYSSWFGLTPDDRVIVLRDHSLAEIYALDLEYR